MCYCIFRSGKFPSTAGYITSIHYSEHPGLIPGTSSLVVESKFVDGKTTEDFPVLAVPKITPLFTHSQLLIK